MTAKAFVLLVVEVGAGNGQILCGRRPGNCTMPLWIVT